MCIATFKCTNTKASNLKSCIKRKIKPTNKFQIAVGRSSSPSFTVFRSIFHIHFSIHILSPNRMVIANNTNCFYWCDCERPIAKQNIWRERERESEREGKLTRSVQMNDSIENHLLWFCVYFDIYALFVYNFNFSNVWFDVLWNLPFFSHFKLSSK